MDLMTRVWLRRIFWALVVAAALAVIGTLACFMASSAISQRGG